MSFLCREIGSHFQPITREFKSAIREISAPIRESRSRLLFCPTNPILREISDVAERQTRGRRQMAADLRQVRRFGVSPRCVNVASMSQNSLTKPSNQGVGCWELGKLRHEVAPEKMRVARALFESRRAEEIALNRARSGAPISRDATERQSAPPELTVAGDRKFESAFLQQRTGSEAKRRAVQVLGAQGAIDYRSEDVVARVVEIT